jgi:hypothetical protein
MVTDTHGYACDLHNDREKKMKCKITQAAIRYWVQIFVVLLCFYPFSKLLSLPTLGCVVN